MFKKIVVFCLVISGMVFLSSCGGGGGGDGNGGIEITSGGSSDPSAIQMLFVGDSLTYVNDLPGVFRQLAESGGYSINAPMVGAGGMSLGQHLNSQATINKIRSQQWQYVILQEQSQIPVFAALNIKDSNSGEYYETEMYSAARKLDASIHEQGAQTIFLVAWGRDESRAKTMLKNHPMSSSQMQEYINSSYLKVAQKLGGRVTVPVGSAWQTARKRNVPDDALWADDGYHPDKAGTYLAACVFYASLFNRSPEGLKYTCGLSENNAKILQKAAWDQVNSGTLDF